MKTLFYKCAMVVTLVLPWRGVAQEQQPQPADDATAMVAQAVKAMEGKVWRVEAGIGEQSESPRTNGWTPLKPSGTVKGLVNGEDFDLTATGYPVGNVRRVGIGRKLWESKDDGRTWDGQDRGGAVSDLMPGLPYPESWWARRHFKRVGTEQHDEGTWLHVREAGDELVLASEPLDCWILLDGNGKPRAMRKVTGWFTPDVTSAMTDWRWLYTLVITPSKDGKIEPPQPGSK